MVLKQEINILFSWRMAETKKTNRSIKNNQIYSKISGPPGWAKCLTRLVFVLAAPLGSGVQHHLLHLLQLLF